MPSSVLIHTGRSRVGFATLFFYMISSYHQTIPLGTMNRVDKPFKVHLFGLKLIPETYIEVHVIT